MKVTSWDNLTDLRPEHVGKLEEAAILPEVAMRMGVRSANTKAGLIYPYRSHDGVVVNVFDPIPRNNGDTKYRWPEGEALILSEVKVADDGPVVLVEGTRQALSVASWAPEDWSVYGMNGCWGWRGPDLSWTSSRDVYAIFDADLRANRNVYDAAAKLKETLELEGAGEIKFVLLPGVGDEGVDDVLAARPADTRTTYLERLVEKAVDKLPRPPKRGKGNRYFGIDGNLLVDQLSRAALEAAPAALSLEHKIAMYSGGVYVMDGTAFMAAVGDLLDDFYFPSYRAAVEEYAMTLLWREGRFLPERAGHQMVNVRNGMVDLVTGELRAHDPEHLSTVQLPVEWDPDARAPRYEAWVDDVGVVEQIDDLEEVASTMLDPSRTPHKAIFLYGPSRSGKSTYLRLLKALAGTQNTSAVTLQQLSTNRFMAANVFGKSLNAAPDLPSSHVEDLSVFKMMTGEDPIQADRKYGQQFMFTNRALFAFSANELPTVGESTRAYSERIKPFRFGTSFAGHEDQAVEDALMAELPGILVRLVEAWQRFAARGRYLDTTSDIRHEFETRSDRVRQWVSDRCRVHAVSASGHAVSHGSYLEPHRMSSKRELARQFNLWAQTQGASPMGERKIIDRLTSIDGVFEVVNKTSQARGLNVVTRDFDDDDRHEKGNLARGTRAFELSGPTGLTVEDESERPVGSNGSKARVPRVPRAPEALVFDLETAGADQLHSYGPGFVRLAGHTAGGPVELTDDMDDLVRRIEGAELVTGHNLMGFDLIALARYHGLDLQALVRRGAVFDTLLAARHADPPMARVKGIDHERRYNLDRLGERFELGGKTGDLKALAKEFEIGRAHV